MPTNARSRSSPTEPIPFLKLGTLYQYLQRLDEALKEFTASVTHNPESADAQYSLGLTLRHFGRLSVAARSRRLRRFPPQTALSHTRVRMHELNQPTPPTT